MPRPIDLLREVAGVDSIIRIHVPFSMIDLSQIEKRLGSFSSDSACYIKEFKYLTQAYDMTGHNIYVILSYTLTSDEKERVWLAAQAHADDVHHTVLTHPVGSMAVPCEDPRWDYQDPSILAAQNYMLTCLLEGLLPYGKPILTNREIIQHPTENPAVILGMSDRNPNALTYPQLPLYFPILP
jgi:hypothetical protein